MAEPAPDPLAAALAAIRELASRRDALAAQVQAGVGIKGIELARVQYELLARTPGLLAAVEAALALAGSARVSGSAGCTCWECEAAGNGEPVSEGFRFHPGRPLSWTLNPDDLRSAISAALLGQDGKGGSDAH